MKNRKLFVYKLNNLNVEERLRELNYKELYIRNHAIKYYYFITVILNKYFYYSRDYNQGYVKVYGELLSDEIAKGNDIDGKNKRLAYVICDHLKSWGVIDSYYREGGSSEDKEFGTEVYYKINDAYYNGGYKLLPKSEQTKKLKANINKQAKKEKYRKKREQREQCLTGVYRHLKATYLRVKFDKKSAQECLNKALREGSKLSSKRINGKVVKRKMNKAIASDYQMFIDKFDSDKYFHVDYKTGRIYSTLTNLPKLFRPFLSIDSESFYELDIASSQPLLVSFLYRKWCDYNCVDVQKDGADYQEICESGDFYNVFGKYVKKNNVRVDETFKVDVFSRIFFNEEYYKENTYQKLFKKRFPSIATCIKDIKKNNYKDVARKLQEIEADLIINKISTRLIAEGITDFFTIHDSISVLNKDKKRTKQIMMEEFGKVNLRPTIKEK